MITYITGDLFDMTLPAIGHGCNCMGLMGAGIAWQFAQRYPEMAEGYRNACLNEKDNPDYLLGAIYIWDESDLVIYNMWTQVLPGPHADLSAIRKAVIASLQDCDFRGITRLGVPRIGAGIGGLSWEDVDTALQEAADEVPDVELVVVSLPAVSAQQMETAL